MDLDAFMQEMDEDEQFNAAADQPGGDQQEDSPKEEPPPGQHATATNWAAAAGEAQDDPLDSFMKEMAKESQKPKADKAAVERVEEDDDDDPMMSFLRHRKAEAKAQALAEAAAGEGGDDADQQEGGDGDAEYDSDDNLLVGPEKREIEVLKPVEHTQMKYAPFKRCFYKEHTKVAGLNQDQMMRMQTQLEIKVFWRGVKSIRPVYSFAHLGLDKECMSTIDKSGYQRPTPIQCQAMPIAMSGHNLLAIAKTGSGKTVAFVIPVLTHLLDQPALEKNDGPIAVLLAPTRELCQQIYTECKRFAKPYRVRVAAVYGGVPKHDQFKELKRGAEIVVATPGRLIDLIRMKATNLHRVTCLVLDEADKMLNMGFEAQVRSISGQVRPDRQTLFFSATFPRKVDSLANVIVGTSYVKVTIGESGQVNKDVTQIIHVMPEKEKLPFVISQAEHWVGQGNLLIFGGTKDACEALGASLTAAGLEVGVLHGDKSQHERDVIMYNFKKATVPVLVATDVAARGLDIDSIRNVVNYDVARDIDSHVHRIGRTGRAGHAGKAYTLITKKQSRFAGELVKNFEHSGQEPPAQLLELAMENDFFRRNRTKGAKRGGIGFGNRNQANPGARGGGAAPYASTAQAPPPYASAAQPPPPVPPPSSHFSPAGRRDNRPAWMTAGQPGAAAPPAAPPPPPATAPPQHAAPTQPSSFSTARAEMQQNYRTQMRNSFAMKFSSGGRLGGNAPANTPPAPIPRQAAVHRPQDAIQNRPAKKRRWDS